MSRHSKKGFTLVELALAISFLSVLLVAITVVALNIITTYQRGLTLKAVNSTGRELIDDFTRSIAASPVKSTTSLCDKLANPQSCQNDNAYKFVFQRHRGSIMIDRKNVTIPTYGAFCTGRYSYIWNSGYTMEDSAYNNTAVREKKAVLEYRLTSQPAFSSAQEMKDFRLIRVPDSNFSVCAGHINTNNYSIKEENRYKLDTSIDAKPIELLSASEENLALYDFVIYPPTQHSLTRHSFYSGTFILATIRGGVDITSTGDYCTAPPTGLSTDFAYCSINKFNFATRATGELKKNEKTSH